MEREVGDASSQIFSTSNLDKKVGGVLDASSLPFVQTLCNHELTLYPVLLHSYHSLFVLQATIAVAEDWNEASHEVENLPLVVQDD